MPESTSEFTTPHQSVVLDSLDDAQNYADWIIAEMSPYLGGQILEIGAGTGTMSERLRHHGTLTSTEPDGAFAARLAERLAPLGVQALQRDWGSATADVPAQSVVAVNVLEHVEDDAKALQQAYDCISPGGHLAVFVPAFQLLFSEFDASIGHYRRYRKSELEQKLKDAGFEIAASFYMNSAGWFAWLLTVRLLKMAPGTGPMLRVYDRFVVPVLRSVESRTRPPFGQSVLVVGRRPQRSDEC